MQIDFLVADVASHDRLDACSVAISAAAGVSVQPAKQRDLPFNARYALRRNGPLARCTIAADGQGVLRRPSEIERKSQASYCIYQERGCGGWWRQGRREFVTRTGDLLLTDLDLPFETASADRSEHEAWSVPKAMLEPHLPATRRPLAVVLSCREGAAALAASYLQALADTWEALDEPLMFAATDTLCRLIGVACGIAAAEQPDAVREGRLAEAKRHIDHSLADPALTPASVADALGISVRALHLLFEPTGTSFARHVLRRRLGECRGALLATPSRAVIDIAFAWGFGSLSSFYRAFQAAFGMSPNDVRSALPQSWCEQ